MVVCTNVVRGKRGGYHHPLLMHGGLPTCPASGGPGVDFLEAMRKGCIVVGLWAKSARSDGEVDADQLAIYSVC